MGRDLSKKVKAVRTRWGQPWQHQEICLNMYALLSAYGLQEPQDSLDVPADTKIIRMTAHAIFASGWRQNCWWYNAWGVKLSTWPGNWYSMDTKEARKDGTLYDVPGAAWRAFTGWRQAIDDYFNRINVDSKRYGGAAVILDNPDPALDGAWWEEMGRAGYYTDKNFTGERFASLCRRVRREVNEAPPEAKAASIHWASMQLEPVAVDPGDVDPGGVEPDGDPDELAQGVNLPPWSVVVGLAVVVVAVAFLFRVAR